MLVKLNARLFASCIALSLANYSLAQDSHNKNTTPQELAPLIVSADLRSSNLQDLPEAITLVTAEQIEARSAQHLEQVLSFAPNVNFASGSSRARFFQIRGIGEESQFIDPVNPSVGLIIDGIDMTGLGTAASMFDVDQVEILRGPQGTRFGANTLAGLINIQSQAPSATTQGYVKGSVGNYHTGSLGAAATTSLGKNVQGRLAVQGLKSNGYMDNTYLNRDDTQDLNEQLVRAKLAWQPSQLTDVNFTYFYAHLNNGYDAFTLDNSRNSLADEPGKDKQTTHAAALQLTHQLGNLATLEASLSGSHNTTLYSYDLDWVNSGFYPPTYFPDFDQYDRTYKRGAVDVRLISQPQGRILGASTDWVVGIYTSQRDEKLEHDQIYKLQQYLYNNQLKAKSTSVYGELTSQLTPSTRAIYGLRVENWRNEFQDSNNIKENTDEWLLSGKLTLEQELNAQHLAYASYARGFKPSGVNSNSDQFFNKKYRKFSAEFNNAYELGLKSNFLAGKAQTRLALFYIQRHDQQVKNSYAINTDFYDYMVNAARGTNQGVELEANWQLTEQLNWETSYGYLSATYDDFIYVKENDRIDKSGREQFHAPRHSFATALTYSFTQALSLRLEAEAKSSFYFEASQDAKSSGYGLYHARLAYEQLNYSIALSGRNLGNKDYATRGYSGFKPDPRPNTEGRKYVQLGAPRLVFLEGSYYF